MNENDDILIQQMAALGISPEMLSMLGHQIGRGEQMADTPMPAGQHVGNTYVAASPLEHLAAAVRKYQGGKMGQQATGDYRAQLEANRQGIAAGQTVANRTIQEQIDALRRSRRGTDAGASVQSPAPVSEPALFGPGY